MTLATLGALAAKPATESLLKLMADYAAKRVVGTDSDTKKIKEHIGPHIEDTFSKCSTIKTLLNPQAPVNFLSIYTTQRFVRDNKHLGSGPIKLLAEQASA